MSIAYPGDPPNLFQPEVKHITVNNVRLRYLDWGKEDNPPMICLHGHTGQAQIWDEFAHAMRLSYHVYALDQRGHGESQHAADGYDRDRFVEDLAAFADALQLEKFTLVGLSMGGWHSLLYTADNPDRVERMVIVDIGPEPSEAVKASAANRPATPMEFDSLEDAVAWMVQGQPWALEQRLARDAYAKLRQTSNGKWTWKADPKLFNTPLPDMTDTKLISRYWKAIETIPCPILEVRGADSPLVSDEILERMKSTARNLDHVDVPYAGHVVTVDNPVDFIQFTYPFLIPPSQNQ